MNNIEESSKVLTTDVLVIGGGIAGIPAAIKAREEGVEVLIVDKAHVGFGGMAPRGGNGILGFPKDTDLNRYIEFLSRYVGKYLNDQNAAEKFAKMVYPSLEMIKEWGVMLSTDKNGDLAFFPFGDGLLQNTGINLNATDNMRKTAEMKGVKIQNHVAVTSLIRVGDKVIGAVGFDIYDGTFYIFKAKTIIVACGACEFKATRMFTNSGEGIKLAWDVGAQMRSAEFAFIEIADLNTAETIHGGHKYVFNQDGENIWDKYARENAVDVCAEMIIGMVKEMREGRGPLYIDLDIMHNNPAWLSDTLGSKEEDGPKKLFPDKIS